MAWAGSVHAPPRPIRTATPRDTIFATPITPSPLIECRPKLVRGERDVRENASLAVDSLNGTSLQIQLGLLPERFHDGDKILTIGLADRPPQGLQLGSGRYELVLIVRTAA